MEPTFTYRVVLAKLRDRTTGIRYWDLTDRVAGTFSERQPPHELARTLNDQIPDEFVDDFKYLVVDNEA